MAELRPATSRGGSQLRRGIIITSAVLLIAALAAILFDRATGSDDNGAAAATNNTAEASGRTAADEMGFATPTVDVFGRRVDVPGNPAGQTLPQTAASIVAGSPDWLTGPPAGTKAKGGWQRVHGSVIPFSTSDGPSRVTDGVASAWAHTPRGAALAAVAVTWQLSSRPGDPAVYDHVLLDETGRKKRDDGIATGRLPKQMPENITRWLLAPDAYRIESYADDLAVIRIATRAEPDNNNAPTWLSSQIVMVWKDDDWRLQPPPDRRDSRKPIGNLVGWTTW